jgi:UrcA family protein
VQRCTLPVNTQNSMEGTLMNARLTVGCRVLLGLAAAGMLGSAAVAQQAATIPEVRVQASAVIKKQTGKSSSGIPIETAVVAVRVGYSDLSLATNSGQALLRERVVDAARDACARVSATFAPGGNSSSDSDCIRTAISDAQPQINAAIEAANTHKAGAHS